MNTRAGRSRGRGERAGLSREAIVREGRRLAQAGGRVSVRALAARLGVDPMALHYWFPGREALLDAVAGDVVAGIAPTLDAPGWEPRFQQVGAALWRAISAHRGLDWAGRALDTSAGAAHLTALLVDALRDSGLPQRDAASAARALLDICRARAAPRGDPREEEEVRLRSDLTLLLDGLRLRALERRVASGRE